MLQVRVFLWRPKETIPTLVFQRGSSWNVLMKKNATYSPTFLCWLLKTTEIWRTAWECVWDQIIQILTLTGHKEEETPITLLKLELDDERPAFWTRAVFLFWFAHAWCAQACRAYSLLENQPGKKNEKNCCWSIQQHCSFSSSRLQYLHLSATLALVFWQCCSVQHTNRWRCGIGCQLNLQAAFGRTKTETHSVVSLRQPFKNKTNYTGN